MQMRSLERGVGSTDGMEGLHRLQQGRSLDDQHAGTHLPRRRPECTRRCFRNMKEVEARLRTRCRGSCLWRRQGWTRGTIGGRPVLGILRPTVVRLFESDVEQVAQVHAGVRIGATTCHQGNWSMPDPAVADRELVQGHGPQDRTSSAPRWSALWRLRAR